VSSVVLLPASFAVLLAGALLFTNAIEWFGSRLELGQGAVGSLLAAVATALPESLIPVVAIIEADAGANEVAIGAILGAPLLLATIAMALVGVAALIYRDRRPQAMACNVHFPTLQLERAARGRAPARPPPHPARLDRGARKRLLPRPTPAWAHAGTPTPTRSSRASSRRSSRS
jgi:hypothetical protein